MDQTWNNPKDINMILHALELSTSLNREILGKFDAVNKTISDILVCNGQTEVNLRNAEKEREHLNVLFEALRVEMKDHARLRKEFEKEIVKRIDDLTSAFSAQINDKANTRDINSSIIGLLHTKVGGFFFVIISSILIALGIDWARTTFMNH